VTGFAVTIDGVRTDYGLAPQRGDGTCHCSIALPFSSGRHTLVVSAYNSAGEAFSDPLTVGPTASAGGPYSGEAGKPLTVTAAGSTDLTGTIGSYVWNWGDGTEGTSANATASHIYASGGTFTVSVTVTDDFPASDTATTTAAIVAHPAPAAPSNPSPPTRRPASTDRRRSPGRRARPVRPTRSRSAP
jgi:hypothetical protein